MKPTSFDPTLPSPVTDRRTRGLAKRTILAAIAVASGVTTPPGNASVGGDYDGDGKADFAVLRDGRLHLRSNVANASSSWIPVELPDLPKSPRTKLLAGDLNGDGRDDLVVSVPGANAAILVLGPSSFSTEPEILELPIPGGPSATAWTRDSNVRGSVAHWLALESPTPYRMQTAPPSTGSTLPTAVRVAVSLASTEGRESLDLVSLPDAKGAPGLFGWLHRSSTNPEAPSVVAWFEALPPNQAGPKYNDTQLSPRSGSAALDAVHAPSVFADPVVLAHDRETSAVVTLFPPSEKTPDGRAVETRVGPYRFVRWLPTTRGTDSESPGRLWVAAADATEASLFRPVADGTWLLESRLAAPSGDSFSDVVALDDGGVAALLASRGTAIDSEASRLAVYSNREGRLVWQHTTDLPVTGARPRTVRVILFDRDPFGDARAVPYESWAVDDWVREARLKGDTVEVAAATYQDARRGLGTSVARVLRTSLPVLRGAYVLANQWEPDSSLHFAHAPAAPGPASLVPRPAPGAHSGRVDVTFAAPAGTVVHARIGNGPWKSGPGPYRIERTAVLEYYGIDAQGRAGAVESGRYSIGEPSAPPKAPHPADSDADGLEDGWETRFFGNLAASPADDTDADGFTDQQEYVASTDPRDPRSRPAGVSVQPPTLRFERTSRGTVALVWSSQATPPHTVEVSEDLRNWRRVVSPPVPLAGGYRWEDEEPDSVLRFYRVIVGP